RHPSSPRGRRAGAPARRGRGSRRGCEVRRGPASPRPAPSLLAAPPAGGPLAGAACTADRIERGVFHSTKGYAVSLPGGEWQVASAAEADLELRRAAPAGGMLADATCEGRAPGRPAPRLARPPTHGRTRRVHGSTCGTRPWW